MQLAKQLPRRTPQEVMAFQILIKWFGRSTAIKFATTLAGDLLEDSRLSLPMRKATVAEWLAEKEVI